MLRQIAIGGYDKNFSYLIGDNKELAIVDPGNAEMLARIIDSSEGKLQAVLITHSHHDHVEGVAGIVERYKVPVYIHERAKGKLKGNIRYVAEGDLIFVGDLKVVVMHTPGHIDDAVCYFLPDEKKVITGDTLFVGKCGKAANLKDLYDSLQRLKMLPDDVEIYPGHDYGEKPSSTIGYEKRTNPYLLCKDLTDFKRLRG